MERSHYRRRVAGPQREEATGDVVVGIQIINPRLAGTAPREEGAAPLLLSELKPACPAGRLRPPEPCLTLILPLTSQRARAIYRLRRPLARQSSRESVFVRQVGNKIKAASASSIILFTLLSPKAPTRFTTHSNQIAGATYVPSDQKEKTAFPRRVPSFTWVNACTASFRLKRFAMAMSLRAPDSKPGVSRSRIAAQASVL